MAGYTAAVLQRLVNVDRHAVGSPGRPDMTGGTFRGHANLSEVVDCRVYPLVDCEPWYDMAGRAVATIQLAGR